MLTFSDIRRIDEIFKLNGWDKNMFLFHSSGLNLYDAVSNFVARVELSNREIVFHLLRHYEIITEYHHYGRSLLQELVVRIDPAKKYYLSPVTLPESGRIKSGANFCYDIFSFFRRDKFPNITFIDSPFSSDIIVDDNTVMIFVDDFVGTGEQYLEMRDAFEKKFGAPKASILLVIRIQEEAFNALSKIGVDIIADQVRAKAITSGRAVGSMSIADARRLYLKVESQIKIDPFMSLGFGSSEAIITMKRTPDNTLPIFWSVEDIGGKEWPAPFPRI